MINQSLYKNSDKLRSFGSAGTYGFRGVNVSDEVFYETVRGWRQTFLTEKESVKDAAKPGRLVTDRGSLRQISQSHANNLD